MTTKPTLRLFDGFEHTNENLRSNVFEIQNILKTKFNYKISVDGFFGKKTEAVVRKFQKEHNLQEDGIIDGDDYKILYDTNNIIVEEPKVQNISLNNDSRYSNQLASALKYKDIIIDISNKYNIKSSIICGIGSRESNWGLGLNPKGPTGTGDFGKRNFTKPWRKGNLPPDGKGFGRGLLQIDYDSHEFARTGNWKDPKANITYGIALLSSFLNFFKRKYNNYDNNQLMRVVLSAYNCGPGNVMKAIKYNKDIDYYTTGRDYSIDVLKRAAIFKLNDWD